MKEIHQIIDDLLEILSEPAKLGWAETVEKIKALQEINQSFLAKYEGE